jgi:hypothetical protein
MTKVFRGFAGEFLNGLRACESGIDPDRYEWYMQCYDKPVVRGPAVSSPGCVVRDQITGAPVLVMMTVREYFQALDVLSFFRPNDPLSLTRMQYGCTNALGFVGYQFGEGVLTTHGVYAPELVPVGENGEACPRLYCGDVSTERWRGGRTELIYRNPWSGHVTVATHVNTWRGRFTGRYGISSLSDLKSPQGQERIVRVLLRSNSREILAGIGAAHPEDACRLLVEVIPSLVIVHRDCPAFAYSGLLAAAHLCGPNAVVLLLKKGRDALDEFSTSMKAYIAKFQGFDMTKILEGPASKGHCLN